MKWSDLIGRPFFQFLLRMTVTPHKLWSSPWGELLLNPETQDPTTFLGKKWITRFRVLFPVYQRIVEMCKESNLFNMKRKSYSVPVECRVLMAKNHNCDTLNELSLVGASTCSKIFCTFVVNFARLYFEHSVFVPEGEQLRKTMDSYKILGFNGCVGSINCTYLRWNKCPREWQNFCIGKEGYPTLTLLVVADHNKRTMIVSRAFFGAANDKLIVKACEETKAIINESMESVCYHLYDALPTSLPMQDSYALAA